ncbi:hypothetical protein B6N60_03452 [Richelia sinica FACHB-800]|uniref:Putative restriction endonuclease domain-containing protein n=1 Tax=Richelia sinica FACHB-800 TaxID=1357546 RepID=A0A975T9Y7_9NOST|nr:Uma2 family endonuclease [Richelia sinica FACHB-800]QXE24744.1 hypothetical protein B6N60_03452 [Richelia sinica FACHB-800]
MENNSIADIVEKVQSGIIHIIHINFDGERVSSGTGFMVNGYLVTNYHVVYQAPKESKIVLKTYDSDRNKPLNGIIELERDEDGYFSGLTNKGEKRDGSFIQALSEENKNDYIVFDIPELREEKLKLYNFSFGIHENKRIGEPIFFLGYHFDNFQLTCHTGIISSFNERNRSHIIQIDASVNSGNSGSPLIDPITHKVIGIITRKETGLDKNFSSFYSVVKNNIDFLDSTRLSFIQQQDKEIEKRINDAIFNKGIFERGYNKIQDNINYRDTIEGIIEKLSQNNANLLEIAKQIERSANVGIGYAFSVDKLKNEKCFLNEQEDIIGFTARKITVEFDRLNLFYSIPKQALVKPPESESGYVPDILLLNRTNLVNEPLWQKQSTVTQAASIPLIIEVVSTNWRDDYLTKLRDYEEIGIPEYWIIDYLGLGGVRYIGSPKQPTISIYLLIEGEYQVQQFKDNEKIISPTFPELNLTAQQIFQAGNI